MERNTWERLAAVGGVGFVVVVLASNFIAPGSPKTDGPTSTIVSYFNDHHTALLISGMLSVLAIPPLLLFLSGLRATLLRLEGDQPQWTTVNFAAGVVLLPIAGSFAALTALLTQHLAAGADAQLTRAVFQLASITHGAAAIAVATFLFAGSVIMMRRTGVTRWIASGGFLFAGLSLVSGCGAMLMDSSGIRFLGLIGFLGFLVWVLATSLTMSGGGLQRG